jgi:hypothetical protein
MLDYFLIEFYSRKVWEAAKGTNLCAYYVSEFINMTIERRDYKKNSSTYKYS